MQKLQDLGKLFWHTVVSVGGADYVSELSLTLAEEISGKGPLSNKDSSILKVVHMIKVVY